MTARTPNSTTIVGWREWVSLPVAGVPWVKAKIDTGARTSSIHAFDIETFEVMDAQGGSRERVRFWVHPWQRSAADAVMVECDVSDRRSVRSSSGHAQSRIVVDMDVVLAGRRVTVEVTLANRDAMGFRMLIGREALRQGFMVDAAHSYVGGRAPREVRLANRSR